jgi:hypothetical protein
VGGSEDSVKYKVAFEAGSWVTTTCAPTILMTKAEFDIEFYPDIAPVLGVCNDIMVFHIGAPNAPELRDAC